MNYKRLSAIVPAALAGVLVSSSPASFAQGAGPSASWPTKPVKLYVGFPAGGPADAFARAFAEHATRALGQPFIVENKPGVNSSLAGAAVATAPTDGYTLLVTTTSHTTSAALLGDRLKFDATRSFTPVCSMASTPTVLTVGPSMPVKTLAGFVQQVKKSPGKHSFATPGAGSAVHFGSERFMRLTGISMLHVPYKGAAPAVNDLIGGQVDSSFATMGSVMLHVQSGKLIALAVSSPKRSAMLPNVPTFEEAGVKGFTTDSWYGLMAPAGTPHAVVATLQRTAAQFAHAPETAKALSPLGIEPDLVCGDAFGAQLARNVQTYSRIARELDLKPE
jgi:tripartite-type tricarboxylate transporter receptor subunit TctC